MRIVAVADTHLYEQDLGTLPDGDVFVHAGDMCRSGSLDELFLAASWIRGLPHATKIVVAGNHDRALELKSAAAEALFGEDVIYLRDAAATIDGLRFWGSPWQPEFGGWSFNLPRGAPLREKWALIPHETQVLVTHGPPAGIGDRIDEYRSAGCDELLEAVTRVRPLVHLFGHIHQDGGAWEREGTLYANVTTWEGERAPTVLDVTAEGVTPVQVPPRTTRAWRR